MPRRKTNKLQKVIYSVPFLLGLAVLVVLVMSSAWSMFQKKESTQRTVERLQAEEQELEERRDIVSNAALDISTERGLESEIREKFSVAKEGERVIVLIDDEDQPASTTDQEENWWQSIVGYIWPF